MKGMYVWNSHDIRKNNLSCVCGSQVCNSSLIRGNSNNSSSSSELCSFINERDRNRDKTISSMNRAGSSYMDTSNSSSCRKVIESTRNISLNTRLHVQMKINAQKISNLGRIILIVLLLYQCSVAIYRIKLYLINILLTHVYLIGIYIYMYSLFTKI